MASARLPVIASIDIARSAIYGLVPVIINHHKSAVQYSSTHSVLYRLVGRLGFKI